MRNDAPHSNGVFRMALTYDVVQDFNATGIQPAAGDPFTYATETSLNVGFTLLPYFSNPSPGAASGQTTPDGTVNNYYFAPWRICAGFRRVCLGWLATLTANATRKPRVIPR